MYKKLLTGFAVLMAVLVCNINVAAQNPPPLTVGDTTAKVLEILEANRYNFQKFDTSGNFLSLAGNVRIRQGKTLFYCDSAVLDQKNNVVEAFGNIHINDEDSIHTYSQYLKYYGKEKDAILKNRVRLTDGKGVLTTNELHYNTFTKIGTYVKGGKVVTDKTVLTSEEGMYYGETRDVYFRKKVVLTDPEFKLYTDTLLYNTFTQIARFQVPTKIVSKQRTITTSEGYYDIPNKKAVFGKRPFIDDKDYTLTANDIAIDEQSGFGDALGNAIYRSKDTANPAVIIANRLQSNNKTSALLATQRPVMIIKQATDSIYIAADTLYSARLSDLKKSRFVPDIGLAGLPAPAADSTAPAVADSSLATHAQQASAIGGRLGSGLQTLKIPVGDSAATAPPQTVSGAASRRPNTRQSIPTAAGADTVLAANAAAPTSPAKRLVKDTVTSQPIDSSRDRFVEAYFNVRIFSDSMQAVGDSLFFSFADSTFRLFKEPIVWAQENQITGDTIYMYTANRKPKRLYVFENGLAINKTDQFFNQVKGTTIHGYFEDGNISSIKAKGSAENIYYAVDDDGKYIGVNRSTCDVIDMYFTDRKPKKIVLRNNLKGTASPMGKVNHSEMRLRGFMWLNDKRPKTAAELFAD